MIDYKQYGGLIPSYQAMRKAQTYNRILTIKYNIDLMKQ